MRPILIASAIATSALAGCNSESSSGDIEYYALNEKSHDALEGAAPEQLSALRFPKGHYEYQSDAPTDYRPCDTSNGIICVDGLKWQELCRVAKLSQYAADSFWSRAWIYAKNSQAVRYLVKKGGVSDISVSWLSTEPRTSKKCRLHGIVSGSYEGSRVVEDVAKFVTSFSVNEDGRVLIVSIMNDGTI